MLFRSPMPVVGFKRDKVRVRGTAFCNCAEYGTSCNKEGVLIKKEESLFMYCESIPSRNTQELLCRTLLSVKPGNLVCDRVASHGLPSCFCRVLAKAANKKVVPKINANGEKVKPNLSSHCTEISFGLLCNTFEKTRLKVLLCNIFGLSQIGRAHV